MQLKILYVKAQGDETAQRVQGCRVNLPGYRVRVPNRRDNRACTSEGAEGGLEGARPWWGGRAVSIREQEAVQETGEAAGVPAVV